MELSEPNFLRIVVKILSVFDFQDVKCADNWVVIPHVVNCHDVLREGSCFIWANARSWAKGFDRLKILHEDLLKMEFLCSNCQGNGDTSKKTFWDISNKNTNTQENAEEHWIFGN